MKGAICDICGANKSQVKRFSKSGQLLCSKHRHQIERYGRFFDRTRFDPNEIFYYEDYAEIVLFNKKGFETGRVKIDLNDVACVKKYKWHKNREGYASAMIDDRRLVRMHRYLISPPDTIQIDHINLDKLDNRRCNLRLCNNQENGFNHKEGKANTSGRVGVTFDKSRGLWVAQITLNYKNIHLGRFRDMGEAIRAREMAEEKYFGHFAFMREVRVCQ